MTWMVTGGAGYIGAHVVRALRRSGCDVIVLDDLSTGVAGKVPADVPLVEASVLDIDALTATIERYRVDGVVHLAAKKAVEESVQRPLWYYEENVEGFRRLLDAMVRADVQRLVLSSSAAVYGMADVDLLREDHPCAPVNPYGQTKLVCEWLAAAAAEAHGLRPVLLRYFNVAGAGAPELGDPGVTNLIPLVLRALVSGEAPLVFGHDYPTPDGSCVRDFIHVEDLAEAHVVAALGLDDNPAGAATYNVSSGIGYSVREVIEVAQRVTGIEIEPLVESRRAGDPPWVVGSSDAMRRELGWTATYGLEEMVASAWGARQHRPRATMSATDPSSR